MYRRFIYAEKTLPAGLYGCVLCARTKMAKGLVLCKMNMKNTRNNALIEMTITYYK